MFVYIRQFCFQNTLSGHIYLLFITKVVGSAPWFNNIGEKLVTFKYMLKISVAWCWLQSPDALRGWLLPLPCKCCRNRIQAHERCTEECGTWAGNPPNSEHGNVLLWGADCYAESKPERVWVINHHMINQKLIVLWMLCMKQKEP